MHKYYTRIKALNICFLGLLLFLLVSCSKQRDYHDKMIFHYNESANLTSLDPAFAKDQAMIWADNQIYNGLLQMDSSLNIQPCIAKDYSISPDGRVYTFILRDDVYFHQNKCFNGKPRRVVAQDFVYSFNRLMDEKLASPGAWIFEHVKKEDQQYCFNAIDDTTLQITLNEPYVPFLGLLTMPYSFVLSKEAVEYYGEDYRKNPVGTGPFMFKFWKEGVKLVLVKNPNYFECDDSGRKLPYLDAINISFIVDKQSVFLEFVKGKIDFISGIDPNYKDEILTSKGELQKKYQDRINLQKLPYLNTEYLGFYLDSQDKNNPLLDKRIRQAINYGFDREKMVYYMRNNIGSAGCYGMIPKGLHGYNEDEKYSYKYDPKKAEQLLQQAGYYEKKPTIVLSTTSSYVDLCTYIQHQLTLLGMNVKLDINPPAELREMMAQGKSTWFRGSWIADYPEAENYYSLFYSKSFTPKGPNYTHFKNERYDKLYLQAIREIDDNKRYALYQQMNEILFEQAPVVVLYYDEVLRFTQKRVKNLTPNPMNLLILKNVYLQDKRKA